jgi:hypothetical protein
MSALRLGPINSARAAVRLAAFALGLSSLAAAAEPIRHPTAVFAGLDKTTGRIINFEVAIDETVQFGSLQVTPHVCDTRPQTEAPQTTSFVEVDETMVKTEATRDASGNAKKESKSDKPEAKRIFSGWMFAASPGLHGIEHPVYDVWLTDCKGGKEVAVAPPAAPGASPDAVAPDAADAASDSTKRSRRSRRVEPETPAPIEPQPIGPSDPPVADPFATGEPTTEPSATEQSATAPVNQGEEAAPAAPKPQKKKKRRRSAPASAARPAPSSSPFPF